MPATETLKTAAKDTTKAAVDDMKFTADTMKVEGEKVAAAGTQAMKDGIEKSIAGLNELNAQSKLNLEAFVASATATAKGAEALSNQAMTYGKGAVERHVEAAKALTSVRSLQEAIEIQTSYAKSAMETYIAEMNRAAEIMNVTVKDAFRPINERATATVEAIQAAR